MKVATLRSVILLLAAGLVLSVGVVDLVTHSRAVTYNVDEIANVDAIHSFLTTGDYTSRRFGDYPFDPFISSGLLTMWPHGIALTLGGSLFVARVVSGFLVMTSAVLLVFVVLRAKGFSVSSGLFVAAGVWLVQSVLPIHRDQLIMNSGEMWGFLYLCVGLLLTGVAPRLAAFVWGLATWLGKFIYLPFALAFLAAGTLSDLRRSGDWSWARAAQVSLSRLGAFVLPLGLWMLVIVLRHGPAELPSWIGRFAFTVTHHTDSTRWGHAISFFDGPSALIWSTLLAVASGPLVLAAWLWMRRRSERGRFELWLLIAAAAVAVVMAVWFLAFDVTQNARHMLPAIYVSMAVAIYCGADLWWEARRKHPIPSLVAAALAATLVVWTCATLADYRDRQGWRLSYAQTCHAPGLLVPPCQQDKGFWFTYAPESELRWPPGDCDNECFDQFKRKIFDYATGLLEGAREDELYTAGYLMLLLQHNNLYQDESAYAEDVQPTLCANGSDKYRRYLASAGLDVARIVRGCPSENASGPERGADVDPLPRQQIRYALR